MSQLISDIYQALGIPALLRTEPPPNQFDSDILARLLGYHPLGIPALLRMIEPPKRKVFVSYYHEDQHYRLQFEQLFGPRFISVSVRPGDIHPDNQDQYVKRLIQEENIVQSTVVFALYGANTYKRKHVDWEISAALSEKVGGRKGLAVMLLPTFPQAPFNWLGVYDPRFIYPYLHPRTAANLSTGYADLYFWPGMYSQSLDVRPVPMSEIVEKAFNKRSTHDTLIDNSHSQYQHNRP
jgi:hypothetical protein